MTWRQRAACRGLDPALFFPDQGENRWASVEALAVCGRCPVIGECRAYNMAMPAHLAKHGIWGGMTEAERRTGRKHPDIKARMVEQQRQRWRTQKRRRRAV